MHVGILCMHVGILCTNVGIMCMNVGMVCSMNVIDMLEMLCMLNFTQITPHSYNTDYYTKVIPALTLCFHPDAACRSIILSILMRTHGYSFDKLHVN